MKRARGNPDARENNRAVNFTGPGLPEGIQGRIGPRTAPVAGRCGAPQPAAALRRANPARFPGESPGRAGGGDAAL